MKVSICLFLLLWVPPFAFGEVSTDQTLAPYFILPEAEMAGEAFPLKRTDVDVQISGVIADVTIRQTYANMGHDTIEAIYVFPASTRAAVHGLTMEIGERRIEAVVQERTEARRTYETAKAEGKTSTLLEQQRPNVFQMNLANIHPGDEVQVELRYTELLVPEEQLYEFVFPTVVGPRYSNTPAAGAAPTDQWVANPYLTPETPDPAQFHLDLTLRAGMPIAKANSPSHPADIQFTSADTVTLSLTPDAEPANNRDFRFVYRLADNAIASGLLLHEGEGTEDNYFLLSVEPPERVRPDQIPPREYCFIVDVSGSMSGFPLDTAKELVRELIGKLGPQDRFNMLFFAGSTYQMAPTAVPANRANIQRALDLLDGQRGGGGTELGQAIDAYHATIRDDATSRSAIVVTDGFISFERDVFRKIRVGLGDANLFAFGIGSSVNRHLIEGMARAGRGEPFVVTRPQEASSTARRFADYVSAPLLTNVRVEIDGADVHDLEPGTLPDLLADRPLILAGKWKGEPRGQISIKGISGNGEFHQSFDLTNVADRENPALRLLWARNRIATLTDDLAQTRDNDTQQAITNLGLTHNLLTEFTSFVAVDQTVRNQLAENRSVKQPLPLPQGVSTKAVGGVKTTPEPGQVGLLLVAMFFFLLQLRRGRAGNRA